MDRDLKTREDIIKAVAAKSGLKEDEVKLAFETSVNYIKTLATDEKTLAIRIPYVGQLYFHVNTYVKYLIDRAKFTKRDSEIGKDKLAKILKNKSKYEAFLDYEDLVRDKGYLAPFVRLKHRRRKISKSPLHTSRYPIIEIERIQNEFSEQ